MVKAQTLKYAIAVLAGATAGIVIGEGLEHSFSQPNAVYVLDLNGDGMNDLVVKNPQDERSIFIGKEDGSFVPLEDLRATEISAIKSKFEDLENRVREID